MAEHIITVTPPIRERAMPAYELAQAVRECNGNVTVADSVPEAVEIAYLLVSREKDAVIVAFGSLSYLGELMKVVEHRDTIRRDDHGIERIYEDENRTERVSGQWAYLCDGDPECDTGFLFGRRKIHRDGSGAPACGGNDRRRNGYS